MSDLHRGGVLGTRLRRLYGAPRFEIRAPSSTALVCTDLQYLFTHPDYGVGPRAKALGMTDVLSYYWPRIDKTVLPNVAVLQGRARQIGLEIIHLRVAPLTADGRDSSRRYRRMGFVVPPGAHPAQFRPEVAPRSDEVIVSKTTSSAFHSTNLDRLLRNLGITTLVVVGVVTNGCVESTARSAAELDYDVIVVEDATATVLPELHEHAIASMSYKDAAIRSTDEILDALASHRVR